MPDDDINKTLANAVVKERMKSLILRRAIDLLVSRGQVRMDDLQRAVEDQNIDELQALLLNDIEDEISIKIGTVH